jgi:hypothetical protein
MRASGLTRAATAAAILGGLSACALPPYDDFRAYPGACMVVASTGFMFDRPCSALELSWLPGAQRLTVGERGPFDIEILEISGRHRYVTIRRVDVDVYCELARDYPNPRVTRNCRTTAPIPVIVAPPAPLSARG